MASTARLPAGVEFQIGDGGTPTEVFTAIANCRSIGFSGAESAELDVTNLSSLNRVREYIQGFKDAGQIEIGIHFDPTVHAGGSNSIMALYTNGRVFNWRVVLPWGGSTYHITGAGFLRSQPSITISPDSPTEATITIRRTGDIAIALVP